MIHRLRIWKTTDPDSPYKKMLEKEFDDQSEEYIEMIADEYFEEHFMEEDE